MGGVVHWEYTNEDGYTPVFLAAKNHREELAIALLVAGAKKSYDYAVVDVLARKKQYYGELNIMHVAAENGLIPLCESLLLDGVPVDLRNSVGLTPLVYAAAEGYVELVKVLLASGANANHLSSPLKFGIIKKRVDVVDILLEKGADPNEREDEFHTLLTMAGSNTVGYYSKYPDIGYTKPWMRNPLTMAIKVKNTDLMEVLVRHGADLNYVTVRGNTPLHIAAYKDNEELCLKLLKLGANKELKNRKGLTPYEVAYARNKDTLGNTIVDF